MFEIMLEDHFASAHLLNNYDGICKNLHGHNYKVQVFLQGEKVDKAGMLIDFSDVINILKPIVKKFDHTNLNDVVDYNPTAELLAKDIYQQMRRNVSNEISISKVIVYETHDSYGAYFEK